MNHTFMGAMFSKEEDGEAPSMATSGSAETIIGPTVKVEGTFQSDDNILVEGEVVGTLKTSKDLTVGSDARIEADVEANNMHISGEVKGNLKALGAVQLASSAKVYGDIETEVIAVENGAVMQGRCTSGQGAPVSSDTDKKEEKDAKKEESEG
ncbi:MAG: polymer-forming cytoskeletal protein [Candidatus Kerfeldbacteria bacterium]